MQLPSLLTLLSSTLLAGLDAPKDPPMPPPPAGMRLLTAHEKEKRLASVDPAEAPAEEIDQESAELEELRALEEVTLDPGSRPGAELLQAARRLGYGNPLRHRMECAFDPDEMREDPAPLPLAPITDLASFDVSLVKDQYDIPLEMQPLVAQYIQFFQGPGRKWFSRWMSRSSRYIPLMTRILEEHGVPKDTVYLAMIESGFSVHAYSWAHAAGPWQFISSTGKTFGLKQDFWVDERRDPIKSTHAAAKYLSRLHGELGNWYLAWAGYNAGGNRVRRMIERHGTDDFWKLAEERRGFARETKHYVPKLIACALVAKHYRAFGFTDDEFQFEPPLEFEEVKLEEAVDLEVLARAAEVEVEAIRELNPELKRWCTPPASASAPYTLRLPKGSTPRFAENFPKIAPHERLSFRVHRVQRGDTLSGIAARYRSAVEAIMRMNGLRSARTLRLNSELVVPVPRGSKVQADRSPALERQVARARRAGFTASRPEEEIPAGTGSKPRQAAGTVKAEVVNGRTRITYGVASGDSLWSIGRRFNVSVDELRRWNKLSRRRHALKAGAMLVIWPKEVGPSLSSEKPL